eukprot:scaffold260365_cov20-Tisochrysis_lutea.AAC.2
MTGVHAHWQGVGKAASQACITSTSRRLVLEREKCKGCVASCTGAACSRLQKKRAGQVLHTPGAKKRTMCMSRLGVCGPELGLARQTGQPTHNFPEICTA